jgi:hypothetical protein
MHYIFAIDKKTSFVVSGVVSCYVVWVGKGLPMGSWVEQEPRCQWYRHKVTCSIWCRQELGYSVFSK